MLLVCRFVPPLPADLLPRARRALELLTSAEGCVGGELGRSVDEPDHWVLTLRFASVHAYRRSLSPFEVREHVVPLLSEAKPEAAAHETLLAGVNGSVAEFPSLLA